MQRRPQDASRTGLLTAAAAGTRATGGLSRAVNGSTAIVRSDAVAKRVPPSADARPLGSGGSTRPTAEQAVVKRKVDEILKRVLPHSIVQSYSKASAALKTQISVAVNGEVLQPVENDRGPLSAQWKAQHENAFTARKAAAPASSTSPGPLHYARSIQYATTHPELSLNETFKTLDVSVTSLSTGSTTAWFRPSTLVLTKKSWKMVAETDRKIGLALYELTLGPWGASSLIVLVWAKSLEVENIYLQLNAAELLYGCPPRPIRILPDDVDPKYGLHSLTLAVTIRDFSRVLWETECYAVECSAPDASKETVSVSLLDEESGYRDRGRFISTAVATTIVTDAISVAVDSAITVDVILWEASCQPVWAASKLLPITTREAPREASDFSMSVAGDKRQLSEVILHDQSRGNVLRIHFERPSASSSAKNKSVFVKQITLELATSFINSTFNTNYPSMSKKLGK